MTRDEVVEALQAQRFDQDVEVDIGGTYVPMVRVRYDPARQTIVVDLEPEDVTDVLSTFFKRQRPAGNL